MATDIERPGAQRWVPEHPDLERIRAAAHDCRGCELWRDATQVVVSRGRAGAPLMLVGEQPGDREDLEGAPFVGPAGRVLADAVDAAGIPREAIYLTNAVKHFRFELRGKRRIHAKPEVGHITACRPWLEAEFDIVQPGIVVALGATAARSVLGRSARIGEVRGRILEADDAARARGAGASLDARVLVTTHPSSILRLPEDADRSAAVAQLTGDLVTAWSAIDAETR